MERVIVEVCWQKALGQSDGEFQRGMRWALPLRGTPATLQNQAVVGVEDFCTRAFADPQMVSHTHPLALRSGSHTLPWADLSGVDGRLNHLPHHT